MLSCILYILLYIFYTLFIFYCLSLKDKVNIINTTTDNEIVSFKINFPEDIEIDIWMAWKDENGKCCKTLMPGSFPDYRDKEVLEFSIDKAQKIFYEREL